MRGDARACGGFRLRAKIIRLDLNVDAGGCVDDVDCEALEFVTESSPDPVGCKSSSGADAQTIFFNRQLCVLEPHGDRSFAQSLDELSSQLGRDVIAVGGHVIE